MGLLTIGISAAAGLFLSDLPLRIAMLGAPICLAWGVMLARRALRAPAVQIVFGNDGRVLIDGTHVDELALDWRGPLTCLEWRSGGRQMRRVAWPDVVPAARRRELRLWRLAHRTDVSTRPVAP